MGGSQLGLDDAERTAGHKTAHQIRLCFHSLGRLVDRHAEREPRFRGIGDKVDSAAMSLRDLRGDVEPEAQTLLMRFQFAAVEGQKQVFAGCGRNWFATVRNGQL